MQWAPKAEAAEIREHADYALAATGHDPDIIYGGGLCIARAVYYLRQKIHTVPRRYRGSDLKGLNMKPKKEKKSPGFKDLILRRIPEDVHRAFKIKCAQEGVGMTEKLIEYMIKNIDG